MLDSSVLERVVFHAGKTFIFEGEAKTDSFVIQDGEVAAFVTDNGKKVEVQRFKPGSIIAEANLLLEQKSSMSYQAVVDTTVVKVTRQDFEKKLRRIDPTIMNIVMHLVKKMKNQETMWIDHVMDISRVDMKAMEIVDFLLRDMKDDRKLRYEEILLPHFNVMVRSLEDLKTEERNERNKKALDDKVAQLSEDEQAEEQKEE